MNHLLRPYLKLHRVLGPSALLAAGICLALPPSLARAQAQELAPILEEPSHVLAHAGSAGYLGVDITDVDADKAQALKLKEVRGALITLIDHDAPAGQIGLKVNDVVLAINGQNVEGAEQLRRMLREIPPGRKVSLVISRDGNIQTMGVQLADRKAMEHDIWSKIGVDVNGIAPASPPAMGILSGGGNAPSSGFHMPFFSSSLHVGALVEPLTSQMAEHLGVKGGVMVKQVARKSEAASAGFKAFDVILKVGADPIKTSADWDRALRANQGKPVQVTILRDKKQQTLTLQVDSKRRGAVENEDLFGQGDNTIVAELFPLDDPGFAQIFSVQADALSKQLDEMRFQFSQEQAGQLRQQTEKLRESMKNFPLDPKQMEDLRKQMDQLRKSMPDPQQMQQFRQRMDQFQRQMNEWREQHRGDFV